MPPERRRRCPKPCCWTSSLPRLGSRDIPTPAVPGAPAEVFDAITNLDLFRLPVTRVLLEARGLPGRLADAAARRRGEAVAPEPPTFRVRDLPARGWIPLGERPGVELVYGAVGKAWKAREDARGGR